MGGEERKVEEYRDSNASEKPFILEDQSKKKNNELPIYFY